MFSFVHKCLLLFSPEIAHSLGVFFVKIYQKLLVVFSKHNCRPAFSLKKGHLESLVFPNRLGLAAGFDKNAELFVGLSRFGFGFIEVGTVTPEAQEGNPKPRLWRVEPEGLINQMGFNNCGLKSFQNHLRRLRPFCSVPVLANIGKNKTTPNERAIEDYQILFKGLVNDVDGFVVNVSSPNTQGLRELQSVEFIEHIESAAPRKPVFVKLAPDLDSEQLIQLCRKVNESPRLSGIVLTNTSRAIAQRDYEKDQGGYSGEKLFEMSLECVAVARENLKDGKCIIGVGGVNSPERAKKMLSQGADLIEVYTGFVYQGPKFIKNISQELSNQSFELSF